MPSTLIIAVSLTATVLAGCGGADDDAPVAEAAAEPADGAAADAPSSPAYGPVTPDEAAALAATEGITVIDVRTPAEYAEGHIEGAALIDFYEPGFADEIAALDPDGEYLVYCRSGNRSGQAVALMHELGMDRVYDLDGGVVGAAGSNLTLVR